MRAVIHDESEVATIGFDEVIGIKSAAMVINQLHESHAPTRWVMSHATQGMAKCRCALHRSGLSSCCAGYISSGIG